MKKLQLILTLAIIIAMGACSPKIKTNITKSYPVLDYKQDVVVIGLNQSIPDKSEKLGEIAIGDNGFSTNCNYEVVIEKAKEEARKVGGNAIKITEHRLPSMMGSSCHRINATILKVGNIESIQLQEEKEEIIPNVDYAILNIYRYGGAGAIVGYDLYLGDSILCRVKNNYKTSIKIKKNGLNTLWARTESKSEAPVNIEFGRTYYLRCSLTMGLMVGRPVIELIDRKTGKAEFESFKAKNQ